MLNEACIQAIAVLGLGILLGLCGQMSLCQAAFLGIGSLYGRDSRDTLRLVVLGGSPGGHPWCRGYRLAHRLARAAAFGSLSGLGDDRFWAHREFVFINWKDLTNGPDGITGVTAGTLGKINLDDYHAFYYVILVLLVAGAYVAVRIKQTRFGRAFEAIREKQIAAAAMGIDVPRYKVIAFVLASAYAGLAGVLFATNLEFVSPDTYSFDLSVVFLVMLVIGGASSIGGAILGAIVLTFLPEWLRPLKNVVHHGLRCGGRGDGDLHAARTRRAVARAVAEAYGQTASASAQRAAGNEVIGGGEAAPNQIAARERGLLEVRGLVKRFGGVVAVNGLDMTVERGHIHALIGPNGSGKTTSLNVISGLYRADGGSVRFDGHELAGRSPYEIAKLGVARTFQNIRLFGRLSVLENVMIGGHVHGRTNLLSAMWPFGATEREENKTRLASLELLEFVGLASAKDAESRSLPYGEQRKLEIARALAVEPRLLLLDEPAAGMNPAETDGLVELLHAICERGITLLLIEHDMNLVMSISNAITVLNFGTHIAEGTADEIARNPDVIAAYLGGTLDVAAAG